MAFSRAGALVWGLSITPLLGCPLLPATNPFDPDAPDNIRASAQVRGIVRYEDGQVGGDILVEALDTRDTGAAVATVNTDLGTGGFLIQVPTGVTQLRFVPERLGFLPTVVNVALFPAEESDIGVVTLLLGPPIHALSGRVERIDGEVPAGIKVEVRRALAGGDACESLVAGEATTASDGTFLIEGLREGAYRVSAFREGLTVDVSDEVRLEDGAALGDTAQTPADLVLSLQEAVDAVTLSSTEEDLPEGVIRLPQVVVDLGIDVAWADEMRLSTNPTFASGSTGWVPAETGRLYPLGDDDTDVRVYLQLRSSCAQSPLYSGRITYDPLGPEIARVRLQDIEAEMSVGTDLVVVEDEVTIPLAIDAGDDTGLIAMLTITPRDGSTPPPVQVFEELGSGLIALRQQVALPLEEGRYDVVIDIADAAGNPNDESPFLFEVIRDEEPPTTPIPMTTAMTVSADVVYVWLQERDCLRTVNGVEESYVAFVCEENPREFGFFEVRGGPELPDFTPFRQPPFSVPVFRDQDTEIEIRAVDEANNTSESLGRVTVTHTRRREIVTLPPEKSLARARNDEPMLYATGGTAFLGVDPNYDVGSSTYYGFLLAQPVDLPFVGLNRQISPFARGVRKLSKSGCTGDSCYQRRAGALGGGAGGISWIEREPTFSGVVRSHQVWPDADGRFDLSDPQLDLFVAGTDLDGEPAVSVDLCYLRGRGRCQVSPSWIQDFQRRPTRSLLREDRMLVNGVGVLRASVEELVTHEDLPSRTVSVTGPAFIGGLFAVPSSITLTAVAMRMEVPEDALLRVAAFSEDDPTWQEVLGVTASYYATYATGGGREEVVHRFLTVGGPDVQLLVGFVVEEGVTADVEVIDLADATPLPGGGAVALGSAQFVVDPESYETVPGATVTAGLADTEIPVMDIFYRDLDTLGLGRSAGVSELRLRGDVGEAVAYDEDLPDDATQLRTHTAARSTDAALPLLGPGGSVSVPDACLTIIEVEQTTALRDLAIRGSGSLDDLWVSFLRSPTSSPYGRFQNLNFSAATAPSDPSLDGCDDSIVEELVRETLTGTLPPSTVFHDTLTGTLPGPTPVDDTVLQGEFREILVVTGDPGDSFKVVMRHQPPPDDGGDADLYVDIDQAPTYGTYACRPYEYGSDETCYITLGPGQSEVHVWADGYELVNPLRIHVEKLEIVDSRPVTAGQAVFFGYSATPSGSEGAFRVGALPTWFDADCYFDSTLGVCHFDVEADGTSTIALSAPPPSLTYAIDLEVYETVVVPIGSWPVGPGQRIDITKISIDPSPLIGAFDRMPTPDDYDCLSTGCTSTDGLIVPGGATTFYLAFDVVGTGGGYEVEVVQSVIGCDEVMAYRGSGGASSAEFVLDPGTYLVTLGSGPSGPFHITWPSSSPSLLRGPAGADGGPIRVLGSASAYTPEGSDVIVSAIDGTAPICDLTLVAASPTAILAMDADAERMVAVERVDVVGGTPAVHLLGARSATSSTSLEILSAQEPPGRDIKEVAILGDHVVTLRAGVGGEAPVVLEATPLTPWPAGTLLPAATSLLTLVPAGSPTHLLSARFDDERMVASLTAPTGAQLAFVRFDVDGASVAATLERTEPLDFAPGALAVDGHDVYLWQQPTAFGGSLIHFDGRQVAPVFPGGTADVTDFVTLDIGTLMAVTRTHPEVGTELVLLRQDAVDARRLIALSLSGDALVARLAPLGGDRFAAVVKDVDGYHLEVGSVGVTQNEDGEDVLVESRVVVGAAAAALDGAPPYSAVDPFELLREPLLAGGEGTLALLGYDGSGGRTVDVFTGPEDVASWASLVPQSFEVEGAPLSIAAAPGVALLTYFDGTSAIFADDGAGFVAVPGPSVVERRVVGVRAGEVLVFESPGDLFGVKPPVWLNAHWTSPFALSVDGGVGDAGVGDAGVGDAGGGGGASASALRLPAEIYYHRIGSVFLDDRDHLYLYDLDATPPVLWKGDGARGLMLPGEGPHRPLTIGFEGVGTAAYPRLGLGGLLWVKRGANGNSLMRMMAP